VSNARCSLLKHDSDVSSLAFQDAASTASAAIEGRIHDQLGDPTLLTTVSWQTGGKEIEPAIGWSCPCQRNCGRGKTGTITTIEISDRPTSTHAGWSVKVRYHHDARRFKLARFPYCLAFQVRGDDIAVIAVAHQSRAPFYWRARAR
jgi:hypothetical protein